MKDIDAIRKLARHAAQIIGETLEEYGEGSAKEVRMGAYGSPSSLVDIRAENAIVDMVSSEDMPFNIFSEEAGRVDRGYERTLIVDPLDGSYNAEHGVPFFAVSIAIARTGLGDVESGIVLNVPTGDEYYASRGEGAYKNGERIRVDGSRNLYAVYLGKKAHPKSFEIARKIRRVRTLGSASLEMCLVAEGIADAFLYLFPNPTLRIVDIAASSLITREAGGMVLGDDLKPLEMGIYDMERRNVVAVATPENLKDLEEVLL